MILQHDPAAKVMAYWRKLHKACLRASKAGRKLIKLLEAEKRQQRKQ